MRNIFIKILFFIVLQIFFFESDAQVVTKIFRPGPVDGYGVELSTWIPDENNRQSVSFDANAWTVGGIPITNRSLLRFDLSSLLPNTVIVSATLALFCNPASTHYQLQAGENESNLLRVITPWDDHTVTWNTQPEVSFANPVFLSRSTFNFQNYTDIDVTAHVQDMINDPSHNYGWEIRLLTEELYRSMQFSSCRDLLQFRPMLTIRYESCTNPVARWNYEFHDGTMQFTDSSSSTCFIWHWDFGDGYFSTLKNPVHQYPASGKYLACLTVTDSCGTDVRCDSVIFCPPMNTSFSSITDSFSVAFHDLSHGAQTWFWDFGDGFFSSLQHPLHVFNSPGTYHVCMRTYDNCFTDIFCDNITVPYVPGQDYGEEQVFLYPVPAWDDLCLKVKYPTSRLLRMAIYNSIGAILLKRDLNQYVPGTVTAINVRNFANGAYLLEIFLENKSIVRKFIINR